MPHTDVIPTSASVASTGLGIRYVGSHCYAYSGTFPSQTAVQTLLEFTTGSGYIIGELTCNAAIAFLTGSIDTGVANGFQISLNGEVVSIIKTESGNEDMPSNGKETFILPALSLLKVETVAGGNNSSFLNTCSFVGRVYGAE